MHTNYFDTAVTDAPVAVRLTLYGKLRSTLAAENDWARIVGTDWGAHKPDEVPTTYIIKCVFEKKKKKKTQRQMDWMFDAVRNLSNADDDKNAWNGVHSSCFAHANVEYVSFSLFCLNIIIIW